MPEHRGILLVDVDREPGEFLKEPGNAADVVEVSMREENGLGFEAFLREQVDDALGLLPGIDDPRPAVFAQDRAIDIETAYLYRQSFHRLSLW